MIKNVIKKRLGIISKRVRTTFNVISIYWSLFININAFLTPLYKEGFACLVFLATLVLFVPGEFSDGVVIGKISWHIFVVPVAHVRVISMRYIPANVQISAITDL